jgi:SAM-dependent methyltransferase
MTDPETFASRLAAEAISDGHPTAWFERVYTAAAAGQTRVPWDRGVPNRVLTAWADEHDLRGDGRRAIVVGCGTGDDAEFIAARGFATTGFDISPTALRAARERYPDSPVTYTTADLFALPDGWLRAFDFVMESMTLQALPAQARGPAIAAVGQLVAPGGTLLVIARAREAADPDPGPPWALTRAEIDALGGSGLVPVRIEDLREAGPPPARRWRAEFTRPAPSPVSGPASSPAGRS